MDAVRAFGGLLLGVGMLVLLVRKSTPFLGEPWGDVALFFVQLIPCVFLYGFGLFGERLLTPTATRAPLPAAWQVVYVGFGLILIPLTLFQFVEMIDGNTGAPLNVAWIFLVTAAAGGYAGMVGGVRFGLLAASISIFIAWLALWDEFLDEGILGNFDTFRILCIVVAAILLVVALAVMRRDGDEEGRWRASEIVTGAGIPAIIAGLISITAVVGLISDAFLAQDFTIPTTPEFPVGPEAPISPEMFDGFPVVPPGQPEVAEASWFWDSYLLVVSALLVVGAAWLGTRGPAYVGTIGLLFFIVIAGLDLDSDDPEASIVGWPLLLVVLGLAALAVSVLGARRHGDGGPSATVVAQPPPPPPPAQPAAGPPAP